MLPSLPAPREARICCLDLETFFVSVERLHDPGLVGQPVVIGAAPGHRGVVTACSYEVREYGVRSGMSVAEAVRLAPHAIFMAPRHGEYSGYAARVREILERFTPDVRAASIDEFYLDFHGTERLHALHYRGPGSGGADDTIERATWAMRDAIQAEIGLPASAGLGVTRAVAKMACGAAKPAGVRMVRRGQERAFADGLPVRRFPGIGPVAEERLREAGIHTLGELLELPPGPARNRFGGLAAHVLRSLQPPVARSGVAGPLGARERPAFREYDNPTQGACGSISNERTFSADLGDVQRVHAQLRMLAERVCWRARQRQLAGRTVRLKLRTSDFHTVERSVSGPATHAEGEVLRRLEGLLARAWDRERPIRLLGVGLASFESASQQLALPLKDVRDPPSAAIDAVRERFGYDAIRVGAVSGPSTWLA